MLRNDSVVHTSDNPSPYCSECLEKVLPWITFDRKDLPSWFDNFHRDLYGLMECSQCTLCQYICNLFGKPHLDNFLARVAEHNSNMEHPIDPDATKREIQDNVGCRSSSAPPPKEAPTVSIRYYTQNSRVDSDGYIDHVVVVVLLQHHVSEVWHDRKAFMIYTEVGMLNGPESI